MARIPNRWIHNPWKAPASLLYEAGIKLGKDYPRPIVERDAARKRALAAWARVKGGRAM